MGWRKSRLFNTTLLGQIRIHLLQFIVKTSKSETVAGKLSIKNLVLQPCQAVAVRFQVVHFNTNWGIVTMHWWSWDLMSVAKYWFVSEFLLHLASSFIQRQNNCYLSSRNTSSLRGSPPFNRRRSSNYRYMHSCTAKPTKSIRKTEAIQLPSKTY